jgi:hypothetical protein
MGNKMTLEEFDKNVEDWYSLVLGWALGRSLYIDNAHSFGGFQKATSRIPAGISKRSPVISIKLPTC